MRLATLARRWHAHPAAVPRPEPGPPGVQEAAKRNRGSLQLRHVDAGSCNGCELEIASMFSPVYDAERFGMRLEDIVVATDEGPDRLNLADRSIAIVA